ncbi:MAG: leucine-rich repeat protein [bacterium]|nr:leucine-rich repeat protein [bacterium]
MMRKLMMTVALAATVFAASANEWTDSATGLTWSYDVVGDAAMIAGCSPTGTSLEIPQTIGGLPVTAIKVYALENWTNLKSLTLHPVKIHYNGEDHSRPLNLAFEPSNKPAYVHYTQTTITNITVRGGGVLPYWFFYECEAVESISFEGAFTGVEDQAFMRCGALKRIALPEGVEYVESEAFRDCYALEEVRLPTSMTNIGSRVFTDDCNCLESLKRIYVSWDLYDAVKKQIDVGLDVEIIRIGDAPGSSPQKPWNVGLGGSVTVFAYTNGVGGLIVYGNGPVRAYEYEDMPWRNFADEITSLTIGKGITAIGRCAFMDLTSLNEIMFEEGSKLTRIDDRAFSYAAQHVTELDLPPTLEILGERAFYMCNPDLKIRIPASVSEMGSFAFATKRNNMTYCGVKEMVFENGSAAIPLAPFVYGSNTAFPKKLKVVIDGETGVPEQWRGNDGLLYATPKAAAEAGCATITAVPPLVNRETATVGKYAKFPLEDLGIPVDTNKYTLKAEGLPKGLSLVTEQIKNEQKKVVGYNYFIEGVPTETLVFATQKAYVRLTNADKTQTLWPLMLEVEPDEPELVYEDGIVGKKLGGYVREIFPQADATWTYKGWPTGLKYTTKPVKDKTFGEIPAYVVYGTFTKAGRFTVTATAPVPGTKYKNTYTAILTVWPDQNARSQKDRYTHQAYAPFEPMMAGDVKSISGLPAGLKFTAKALTDKTFGEIPAGAIYGMPTKAGVYTVTAKTFDGESSSILWTITPPDAPTFALDTGAAPIVETKAQVVQGANQAFAIAASEGAKVTAAGLPSGLKLVQGKATKAYSVEGVATKPGDYRVTFKTVLNGVTTLSVVAFTVKGNPLAATYCGYTAARPAAGEAYRLAVAEVTVAAAGTVKLTYTEGKTKYTASVKSFDWNDAKGKGTASNIVLKVSSADKTLGYGDRKASLTFEDCGVYLMAKLDIADANGSSLVKWDGAFLYATVKTTEVPLPASQTYVFRTKDSENVDAIATVSVAYDANKATAAFSGKLFDGTAVKATVPVTRVSDDGTSGDYAFAPFLVIAKDGTVICFENFCGGGGYVDLVREDGERVDEIRSTSVEYTLGDKKFAELVPETGAFTFGWGGDAEIVGADVESFAFAVTKDKNDNPAGVAIYDVDAVEGEKPLATVSAKVGKATGAISVSFTSKKGDKAKYAAELVWRGEKLFAGHVTRTWKGLDPKTNKSANLTAYGTAIVEAKLPPTPAQGGVQLWADGPFWTETNLGESEDPSHPEYGALYTFDEAASSVKAMLGPEWRMPSKDDFAKLVDTSVCTQEWDATRKGWTFTGKGDYSSNSIFLPLAGYEDGEVRVVAGERGWYWSSDATDATYAWGLYLRDFSAFNPSVHDQNFRYLGYPVRAVR